MGAVATDGTLALNAAIIHEFRIPEDVIDAAVEQESRRSSDGNVLTGMAVYRNGPRAASPSWSTTGSPPGQHVGCGASCAPLHP